MSKLFFFKENDTNDRDCVRYLDVYSLNKGNVSICGACFWGTFGIPAYKNVTTVLTEDEYYLLFNYNGEDLTAIVEKLRSRKNDKLFELVQEEEIEYLMDEYNLDEEEVLGIFEDYNGSYRDRGIISCVYDDAYDLGNETAHSRGYINGSNVDVMERYFDFEKFGEDLLDDYDYYELKDGRVVSLNY